MNTQSYKLAKVTINRPGGSPETFIGHCVGETTQGFFVLTEEQRKSKLEPSKAEWFPKESKTTNVTIL
jgi:hypothetical protein